MRKKSVIVFLLITLISLISITEVFAQNDSNWFYNKPIARIIFDGLVHINREDFCFPSIDSFKQNVFCLI